MKVLFSVALLACALVSPMTAHAQDDLARIRDAGEIRIGTEGTYAPFTFHDASGLTGFDVEMGRAIAERLGVKARFVEGKWDGLIVGLAVGRYDAVMNQVGTLQHHLANFDVSHVYLSFAAVLIVGEDKTVSKDIDYLKGNRSANTLTSNYVKLAHATGAQVVAVKVFY